MTRPSGKGRKLCFDSENRGFLNQVHLRHDMHVVYCIDAETEEKFLFFDDFEDRTEPKIHLGKWEDEKDGNLEDAMKFLREADVQIIQNGTGYDAHVFEKIFPKIWKGYNYFEKRADENYPFKYMDTYTMSCTLNPERKAPFAAQLLGMGNVGPHSIAAHGIRMNRHKPDHEDWDILTEDMLVRVMEDTEIGLDMFRYLMTGVYEDWTSGRPVKRFDNKDDFWEQQLATPNGKTKMDISNAYYCELRVAFAVARQAIRGFPFDVGYAAELLDEMDTELHSTEKMFRPHMPMRIKKKKAKMSASAAKAAKEQMGDLFDDFLSLMGDIEWKGSELTTVWNLTNKPNKQGHKIAAAVTKHYGEMVGYMEDHKDPLVAGPFTPVRFEDIPLGNRDAVKQVLYKHGWRGVKFNDTEQEHIDEYDKILEEKGQEAADLHGELPFPWSGKIDDKSIERWKENGNPPEWALGIARWYVVDSRRTQICNAKDPEHFKEKGDWPRQTNKKKECRGLLPRAWNEETGQTAQEYYEEHGFWPDTGNWRVPAIAFHAATNTYRMRHRVVVNIPSRGLYGHEMRKLFAAHKGKLICGCDGAGLELRMLAHFMGDDDYTDTVLNGDIHTYNQKMAGLPLRDMAKTFIYAFLYGSGVANLAKALGIEKDVMAKRIAQFRASLPSLDRLLEGVQRAGARGFMSGIDGRRGRIRKRSGEYALHTALNVLLQMTGSITMKYGHIFAEDMLVEAGVIESVNDFPIIAHVHDEAQMEINEDEVEWIEYIVEDWDAEEKAEYFTKDGRMWSAPKLIDKEKGLVRRGYHPVGEAYALGIKEAGEYLGLRCPTAGEYMIGKSWLDTH